MGQERVPKSGIKWSGLMGLGEIDLKPVKPARPLLAQALKQEKAQGIIMQMAPGPEPPAPQVKIKRDWWREMFG